mmetsp:Transcript_19264/g.26963  ORF Transcript_19264/g.26963 Transcript_19264/m.26963 type:complete len:223 (-) Transcript_19264:57-725(-)
MNTIKDLAIMKEELEKGMTFSFGKDDSMEGLMRSNTFRIKSFPKTSEDITHDFLNDCFKKTGVFDHRFAKPDDAPSMKEYFTDYYGNGVDWCETPVSEFPTECTLEGTNKQECECHPPIGYTEQGNFVPHSIPEVAQKLVSITETIKKAAEEQQASCYYAHRGCGDETDNTAEEYGEECFVFIMGTQAIVVWSEWYDHAATGSQSTTTNASWLSTVSKWIFG